MGKNIYMNCNLPEGAKKATEEALKNLINQVTEIFTSLF